VDNNFQQALRIGEQPEADLKDQLFNGFDQPENFHLVA
jgi:hypothetical protein